MSTFLLCPIASGLPDPAWNLSWHSDPCEIAATSAEEARRIAAGRFTVAMLSDPSLLRRSSPWYESRLVTIKQVGTELVEHCLVAA